MKQQLLFEFLQVSVGRRTALTLVPTAADWDELFDFCFRYGMGGMGLVAIQRLCNQPAGMQPASRPNIMQMLQWTGQAELIRQQNETANRLCAKVCRILGRHHLNPIILKGQSLARLYDRPEARKPGDIDVWCWPKDGAYHSLSWRRNRIREQLRPYVTSRQARQVVYHHMEFTSIENTSVEVHFTPSWMFNPLHNRRFQRWVVQKRNNPDPADAEFNAIFVLLHIFRHLFAEGANIRQLTDYYFVLKAFHQTDRHKKAQMLLKQMGLYKFAGAIGYALKQIYDIPDEWLLAPIDEQAGKILLDDVLTHSFDHDLDNKRLQRFIHFQKRRMRYYLHYPSEALWALPFIAAQWLWRKWNGFAV